MLVPKQIPNHQQLEKQLLTLIMLQRTNVDIVNKCPEKVRQTLESLLQFVCFEVNKRKSSFGDIYDAVDCVEQTINHVFRNIDIWSLSDIHDEDYDDNNTTINVYFYIDHHECGVLFCDRAFKARYDILI